MEVLIYFALFACIIESYEIHYMKYHKGRFSTLFLFLIAEYRKIDFSYYREISFDKTVE